MKRKVIEPFYYAYDGKNAKLLRAGRVYPFHASDAARFELEGYIAAEMPPMVSGRFFTLPRNAAVPLPDGRSVPVKLGSSIVSPGKPKRTRKAK